MKKVTLKLLKPWKKYFPGEIVFVPAGVLPERMIKNGTAQKHEYKKSIIKDLFSIKETDDGSNIDL